MSDAMWQRAAEAPASSTASPSSSYMAMPAAGAGSGSNSSGGMSESGIRAQMQSLDTNLGALCEHVQAEGWNSRAFSDIVVQAMGSTFYLHRLLLSRSSYFRNMLQGPWKEANAPEVRLQIDDENVNAEAVATALSYLYGHHPKLDDGNAFRVLAAASFLDLQDLCAFCTDFIISDLWTENFLSYQAFAESQDYGIHGERVRKACWGYLCRGGAMELREVLPKLSSQTLRTLLTSDELWVPSEVKRFELALSVLIARGVVIDIYNSDEFSDACSPSITADDAYVLERVSRNTTDSGTCCCNSEGQPDNQNDIIQAVQSIVLDMVDSVATSASKEQLEPGSSLDCDANMTRREILSPDVFRNQEDLCRYREQEQCSEASTSSTKSPSNHWTGNFPCASPCWGGRVVGRRLMKAYPNNEWTNNEEWDTFMSTFEGGGIHYSHMAFEDLLETRARLEELGFPCKSVADGLWLQTLLRQQVLTVAADTCKICSLALSSCTCRQSYVYPPHSRIPTPNCYREEQDKGQTLGNFPESNSSSSNVQSRVHVRGSMDGLAGIGRGNTYGASGAPWPPSRFMFSRVPFTGPGNRNQQNVGNDQADMRFEFAGTDWPTYSVDGLNVVVGLSQGISSGAPAQSDQSGRLEDPPVPAKAVGESANATSGIFHQKVDGHSTFGESCQGSSISLDLHTPLRCFPPFRFGVEFDDVQRLTDGQSKHSPEVFYAGSLWKVSVQAFNDEDPRCRRTLGLFLHRRKADDSGPFRKVSLYIDSREKVTARYQLICPAKRGVMILGSLTQAGTLLPKAPKGWGWRTAFLFDELVDLLQGNSLRVAAVVQVV